MFPKFLKELNKTIDAAERFGFDYDVPEGARYIHVSDTLAKDLSANLEPLIITLEKIVELSEKEY